MGIVDGIGDDLLRALLTLEQCVEDCYDWSKYREQGMVGVVYLNRSVAQERYSRVLRSAEVELEDGIYCARDISPLRECRQNPFALVVGLANSLREDGDRPNPVISCLAHAGFVGLFTVEASKPRLIDSDGESVQVTHLPDPHRFMSFRSATTTIGFMRKQGDEDARIKIPAPETEGESCGGCNYCSLEYLVFQIASRA